MGISAKNGVIFAVMWLGEAFLILMFIKWVIQGSPPVLALGSLDALWFDNGIAPELDYARDASVREQFRTSWEVTRKTAAAGFSVRHGDASMAHRESLPKPLVR